MGNTVEEGMELGGAVSDQGGLIGTFMQAAGQSLATNPARAGLGNGLNGAGNHIGGPMSLLSMITGGYTMLDSNASTADRVVGGGNVLTGGIGTAGYIGSLAGAAPGTFLSGLGTVGGMSAGGVGGLSAPAFAASTYGAGAAGGTGAAVGTGLATGGAVLGAGLAGYGVGSYGNSKAAEYEIFGTNANGKGKTGSEWAADAGIDTDRAVDEATGIDWLGDVAGLGMTAGMSIAAVPGVVGSAAYGAGSAAVSFIGGIFSW